MAQSNLNKAGLEAASKVLTREFGCSWDELTTVNQIAKAAIAAYLECVDDTYIGCPHCQAEFAIGDGL